MYYDAGGLVKLHAVHSEIISRFSAATLTVHHTWQVGDLSRQADHWSE